jgi:hypothetical protein
MKLKQMTMSPHALDDVRRGLGLSYLDLWIECFALGGNLAAEELERYLHGDRPVSDTDHNVIVHALNEYFFELGQDHPLAYRPTD